MNSVLIEFPLFFFPSWVILGSVMFAVWINPTDNKECRSGSAERENQSAGDI